MTMPRPPLPVGTAGKIGFTALANGRVRARAFFRDFDGVARPVTRYGSSRAAAERKLKEALRDRRGPADGDITPDTRLSIVAEIWRDEIKASELSDGTKESYGRTLDKHVLRGLGGLLVREATASRV